VKENVPVALAATTGKELPPRVQEALGELVGVAQEGCWRCRSASGSVCWPS